MPSDTPFISFAQNREDVVLWRTLCHVPAGRYVEVGANHPRDDSVTRAFYDRGWSGITVEPLAELAQAHRDQRPRDTMVEAVITDTGTDTAVLHEVPGTGLSSIIDEVGRTNREAGHDVVDTTVPAMSLSRLLADHGGIDQEVHFLLVDTEGAEANVLASVDLRAFRPWVLVIEATAPNSSRQTHDTWEPDVLAAGYRFCLFDGISRFYVAEEHADELAARLSYPACVLDGYVEATTHRLLVETQELRRELIRWRATALRRWARATEQDDTALARRLRRELSDVRAELDAIHATVSWRVTRPIRAARRMAGHR